MKKFVFLLMVFHSTTGFAQEESKDAITVSGYLDTYYLDDFNKPQDGYRPAFVYAFNRTNEVAVNIGFIKASYLKDRVRANLALMAGTYANANLAAEPGVLKNLYEANAGVKLSATKNVWLDAGILPSHIGFESAVGKDCWNLTRSLLADNSPYFESGVKLSYTTDNSKWFLSALLLNGWQRIQTLEGNTLPSGGTQITFTPSAKLTLNSSTFIGTDKPDSARLMRYFHNFYGIYNMSEKLSLTFGFDYGAEEKNYEGGSFNTWYASIFMIRGAVGEKFNLALRGEYYHDKNSVIVNTTSPNGFRVSGISLNFDYAILENALWRIEARNFTGRDNIFMRSEKAVGSNVFITTSLAISF
jgi:hypothetical protein